MTDLATGLEGLEGLQQGLEALEIAHSDHPSHPAPLIPSLDSNPVLDVALTLPSLLSPRRARSSSAPPKPPSRPTTPLNSSSEPAYFRSSSLSDLSNIMPQPILNSARSEAERKFEAEILTQEAIAKKENEMAREAYIAAKLNPLDPIEGEKLKHKLALTYSDTHPEETFKRDQELRALKPGQNPNGEKLTLHRKLQLYKLELGREYDERQFLEEQQKKILEDYVEHHFEKPRFSCFSSFSLEDIQKEEARQIQAARENFLKKNHEVALHKALKTEIRKNPLAMPEGLEKYNKENKMQKRFAPRFEQWSKDRRKPIEQQNKPVFKFDEMLCCSPEVKGFVKEMAHEYRKSLLNKERSKPRVEKPKAVTSSELQKTHTPQKLVTAQESATASSPNLDLQPLVKAKRASIR